MRNQRLFLVRHISSLLSLFFYLFLIIQGSDNHLWEIISEYGEWFSMWIAQIDMASIHLVWIYCFQSVCTKLCYTSNSRLIIYHDILPTYFQCNTNWAFKDCTKRSISFIILTDSINLFFYLFFRGFFYFYTLHTFTPTAIITEKQ